MIDLHLHSSASDGTFSPSEVVRLAAAAGLSAVSLTDHDTAEGIPEARSQAAASGIEFLPGIEMTCVWRGTEIHLLGYFLEPDLPGFQEALGGFAQKRAERNEAILDNLAEDGIFLEKRELCPPDRGLEHVTLGDFARALTERGVTREKKEAMQSYLRTGGRYVSARDSATPEEVLAFFRAFHIWPSLAHPAAYHLKEETLGELLQELLAGGLRGIEIWHPSQTSYESARLLTISRLLHLLPTGGSDFHGTSKPEIRIGRGFGSLNVQDSVLAEMKRDYATLP